MTIKLNRKDIENLIRSIDVPYSLMEEPIISQLGYYTGGFHDRWDWLGTFKEEITDQQLWETYQKLNK